MKNKFVILLLVFLTFGINSCFKPEVFPPEPNIEFVSCTFIDTIDVLDNPVLNGTLKFYFVDGDGDIGFDTTSPRKNTIFLEKYKIKNSQEVLVELLVPLEFYVPLLENSEPDIALRGEMLVNDLNELTSSLNDTIMYKFYIVDRAGNKSNVETTGPLVLR